MLARLRREWWWYWHSRQTTAERLGAAWTRFWLCRVRDSHQVKFATAPRCYRCAKTVS